MIKAIIFDLDGTLADTIKDIHDAVNSLRNELSLPEISEKQTISNINNGAFMLIKRSLPELKDADDDTFKMHLKTYEGYYQKCYNNKTALYPGIRRAIEQLKQKNIPLAVLSNKQDVFVKNIIKKLFDDNTFDIVIGQGSFPTKPDPSSVMHICDTLGVLPKETALVGDSDIDIKTAINAGALPIGVSWGYRDAQVIKNAGADIMLDFADGIADIPNMYC